jgi:hypothetical protein
MAQKVVVQLVDDLDGTESGDITTVQFGLDGVTYEIDLTEANAGHLRDELAVYVAAGRRLGGRLKRGVRPGGGDPEEVQRVRDWAAKKGIKLSPRGRIPKKYHEQYQRETAKADAPAEAKKPNRRPRSTRKK